VVFLLVRYRKNRRKRKSREEKEKLAQARGQVAGFLGPSACASADYENITHPCPVQCRIIPRGWYMYAQVEVLSGAGTSVLVRAETETETEAETLRSGERSWFQKHVSLGFRV
jgi:hypothetical protein